ncbi:MAG TPA: hypothetical protein VFX23_07905 [Limnobacter sp.]|uniref:hypothetical protein n=1 Tax=Limnobacter sp. TaxID=2003368 RepID=UPI002E30C82E|nr:hypothetical protein [Limnobacter sp.]HEX5485906.1 hypothetical protein [Limnobacter sp.]
MFATAVVLFLPLGSVTLCLINTAGGGAWLGHVVGLLLAVAIHAAILLHARRKLLRFELNGGKHD